MKIEHDYSPMARVRSRLQELMTREKLDKRQFADKYGYRIGDLNALFNHNSRAVEMLVKICDDCEVEPSWLLGLDNDRL